MVAIDEIIAELDHSPELEEVDLLPPPSFKPCAVVHVPSVTSRPRKPPPPRVIVPTVSVTQMVTVSSREQRVIARSNVVRNTPPVVAAFLVVGATLLRVAESGSKTRMLQRSGLPKRWYVRVWATVRAFTSRKFWQRVRVESPLGDTNLWAFGSFACKVMEKELIFASIGVPLIVKVTTNLEPFLKDFTKSTLQSRWNLFYQTEKNKIVSSMEKTMESIKESANHFHQKMKDNLPDRPGTSSGAGAAVLPQNLLQWGKPVERANGNTVQEEKKTGPSAKEVMEEVKTKLEGQMTKLQEQLNKLAPAIQLPSLAQNQSHSKPKSLEDMMEHFNSLTNRLKQSVTALNKRKVEVNDVPPKPAPIKPRPPVVSSERPPIREPPRFSGRPVKKTDGEGFKLLLDEEIQFEKMLKATYAPTAAPTSPPPTSPAPKPAPRPNPPHAQVISDPMGMGNLMGSAPKIEQKLRESTEEEDYDEEDETYFPGEEIDDGW